MRTFTSFALLGASVLVGCAPALDRAVLEPAAKLGPHRELYAQVREMGFARKVMGLRVDDSVHLATVVDVKNTSSSAISVEVGKATLTFESGDTSPGMRSSAVGAGTGGLPANAEPTGSEFLRPITILPGGELTFWVLFEPVPWMGDRPLILSIPIQSGHPLLFTVREARVPRWKWKETQSQTSLSMRLMNHSFGSDADLGEVGMALWYARNSLKFGFAGKIGTLYDRSATGFQRARTSGLELSAGWHPPSWLLGAYGAGHLTFVEAGEGQGVSSRKLPGLTIGVEAPVLTGRLPVAVVRIGYTNILANSDHRHGLSISIDARLSWP